MDVIYPTHGEIIIDIDHPSSETAIKSEIVPNNNNPTTSKFRRTGFFTKRTDIDIALTYSSGKSFLASSIRTKRRSLSVFSAAS